MSMSMTYLALGMATMAAMSGATYYAASAPPEPYLHKVDLPGGGTSWQAENVYACKRIPIFDVAVICTASSLRDPRLCHALPDASIKQQCLAQVKP